MDDRLHFTWAGRRRISVNPAFIIADFYDEDRLTIDENGIVWETISPNPKRVRRKEWGPPQDLQFKAVHAKKSPAGKIIFWIGMENAQFVCNTDQQREEILTELTRLKEHYSDKPNGILVPFDSRSFFVYTEDGFTIDLPSPYARSSFGERVGVFVLMLFFAGYWWGKIIWETPDVVRQCIQFWQLFPSNQAIHFIVLFTSGWLLLFCLVVLFPLMLLNRSYWTSWKIQGNLHIGEISAVRSSLFGRKKMSSPINRLSISRKPGKSWLRLLWIPYWFDLNPIWERDSLLWSFDGGRLVLPCGSKEEVDWLIQLIRDSKVDVTENTLSIVAP